MCDLKFPFIESIQRNKGFLEINLQRAPKERTNYVEIDPGTQKELAELNLNNITKAKIKLGHPPLNPITEIDLHLDVKGRPEKKAIEINLKSPETQPQEKVLTEEEIAIRESELDKERCSKLIDILVDYAKEDQSTITTSPYPNIEMAGEALDKNPDPRERALALVNFLPLESFNTYSDIDGTFKNHSGGTRSLHLESSRTNDLTKMKSIQLRLLSSIQIDGPDYLSVRIKTSNISIRDGALASDKEVGLEVEIDAHCLDGRAVAFTVANKTKTPELIAQIASYINSCLLYTSPSPRDATLSRMPSSA